MSGNSLFVDTNIILYLLSGDSTIADLFNGKSIFISFITQLELLGFKDIEPHELRKIEEFLTEATIVDINSEIKRIVINLRRSYKIKLPDAIVAASSLFLNLPLLTADRQLSKLDEINFVLYEK
ncbi:MAG: twitching motility protein PilT [Daejeonella sp.]|nr:twitching motility protein PilT [Daejeonella sp.]